jgi:D-tyrosyl-tRNA(Tyr) deacylase
MRAVVQRSRDARVSVSGATVGSFDGPGLVVLVGVTHDDTHATAYRMADKVYDLYGETRKGRRPTWDAAAPRPIAEPLVEAVAARLRERGATVATGVFGADMQVSLTNDGPMTITIEI